MNNLQTFDDIRSVRSTARKSTGLRDSAKTWSCAAKSNINHYGPIERLPRTSGPNRMIPATSDGNVKNKKTGDKRRLEKALWRWFTKYSHYKLSRKVVFFKARQIAKNFGVENFTPTDGWLTRWKERHNIIARLPGEKKVKESSNARVETVDLVSDSDHDDNHLSDQEDEAYFDWNEEFPLVTAVLEEQEDNHRIVINAEGQLVMVDELEIGRDKDFVAYKNVDSGHEQDYAFCEDGIGQNIEDYTNCEVEDCGDKGYDHSVREVLNGKAQNSAAGKVVEKQQENIPCEMLEDEDPLLAAVAPDSFPNPSSENVVDETLPPTAADIQSALSIIKRTLDTLSASEDDFCLYESLKAKVEVLIVKKGLV